MKTGKLLKFRGITRAVERVPFLHRDSAGCKYQTLLMVFAVILSAITIPGPLHADDAIKKQSILLYDFQVTDNTTGKSRIKAKEKQNLKVFTFIIPDTISKNILSSGKYDVVRDRSSFTIKEAFTDSTDEKTYIKTLQKSGKERNVQFIISGKCIISDNSMEISAVIFNVRGGSMDVVSGKSDELGVLVRDSTDFIASKIDERITSINSLNEEKFRPSPFIGVNNAFSVFSAGVDGGYMYILGDWKDVYDNTKYFSPFILVDIPWDFSLQLKYDYIKTDNGQSGTSAMTSCSISGTSLSLMYNLNLTDNFSLFTTCGGGLAFTRTIFNPGPPFSITVSEDKSTDPVFDCSAGLSIRFSIFSIRAGVMYRNIFYDTKMHYLVYYAGAIVNL